jgi:hypothetical protein
MKYIDALTHEVSSSNNTLSFLFCAVNGDIVAPLKLTVVLAARAIAGTIHPLLLPRLPLPRLHPQLQLCLPTLLITEKIVVSSHTLETGNVSRAVIVYDTSHIVPSPFFSSVSLLVIRMSH